MAVKQTIAIAGVTGETGNAIAHQLAQEDFRLLLMSEDTQQLAEIVNDIKIKAPGAEIELVDCIKEGCWEADIIILAIPSAELKEVAEKIKEVATQKIVVSISNPEDKTAEIEELTKILPHSRIVLVCISATSNEAFIAADDTEAVQLISNTMRTAGFFPLITTTV